MAENQTARSPRKKRLKVIVTIVGCLLLLSGAGLIAFWIQSTEPKAQRVTATRRSAMLVDVTGVDSGTFRPTITELGRVEPARDIELRPRVSGEIRSLSPNFTPGGFVTQDEVLLKIDPADYEIALAEKQGDLEMAEADLAIEMGRQKVAKLDYELFEKDLAIDNESLILREPQLNAAKASIDVAESAVARAALDLERTTVRAPFDGQILTREINVGSQIGPETSLGRLVGIDEYWVVASIPLSKLNRIAFPGPHGQLGSLARVRNRSSWESGVYREGRVDTVLGALDEETRLARVLITIPDPLARSPEHRGQPPLIGGSVLEVQIDGEPLNEVVRLQRDYLRKDDTVWVMEEGELKIVEVEVLFRDSDYVYIREGLTPDARVVTTNLATVVEGAPLRLEDEESPQ